MNTIDDACFNCPKIPTTKYYDKFIGVIIKSDVDYNNIPLHIKESLSLVLLEQQDGTLKIIKNRYIKDWSTIVK